jgi:hypothetical protein
MGGMIAHVAEFAQDRFRGVVDRMNAASDSRKTGEFTEESTS